MSVKATTHVSLRMPDERESRLHNTLLNHDDMLKRSHVALRERLQRERSARDAIRRDKQLNDYVQRKIEAHHQKHSAILTSGASEAFSWRNIEDKRDMDTRLRRYRHTEQCEVIDVTAWARQQQQPLGGSSSVAQSSRSPRDGRSPRSPRTPRLNVSRHSAIIEKPTLSITQLNATPSMAQFTPRLQAGAQSFATKSVASKSNVSQSARTLVIPQLRRKSSKSTSVNDDTSPSRTSRASPARKLFGGLGGSDKKLRGISGLKAQISGVLLPSLALGSGITQKSIAQCELDFGMLSYGRTHILMETLLDYGAEHVADFGHRRVMFIEFIDYMKRNRLNELPFVSFVHIVHPRWPRSGIPQAVQHYATAYGWALGLPFDLAECINKIWIMANTEKDDEGQDTISFAEFARLCQVESSFALDFNDLRAMFYATDTNGNGLLSKDEFAQFVAGKVNIIDVPVATAAELDEQPIDINTSGEVKINASPQSDALDAR
jgi:hypothetical protein